MPNLAQVAAFASLTGFDWLFGVGAAFVLVAAIGLVNGVVEITRALKAMDP